MGNDRRPPSGTRATPEHEPSESLINYLAEEDGLTADEVRQKFSKGIWSMRQLRWLVQEDESKEGSD